MLKSAVAAMFLMGLVVPAPAAAPPSASGPSAFDRDLAVVTQSLSERTARRLDTGQRDELARVLVREAHTWDLEPALVLAVIHVESRFDPAAVSPAGAYGLMQVRRPTGLAGARRLGIPWRGVETLVDPVSNVRIGIAYLARLRDRFGSLPTALSAYNQGPTRVSRRLGSGQRVHPGYARRVMQTWAGNLPLAGS